MKLAVQKDLESVPPVCVFFVCLFVSCFFVFTFERKREYKVGKVEWIREELVEKKKYDRNILYVKFLKLKT